MSAKTEMPTTQAQQNRREYVPAPRLQHEMCGRDEENDYGEIERTKRLFNAAFRLFWLKRRKTVDVLS
jgi:hypothetical protein